MRLLVWHSAARSMHYNVQALARPYAWQVAGSPPPAKAVEYSSPADTISYNTLNRL